MIISQIAIMILGSSAIWLVGRKEKWRRWGYIIGMASQPFWMWSAIDNDQWGILIMSFFYAYSWGQGIWNYWLKQVLIKDYCEHCDGPRRRKGPIYDEDLE